MMSSVVAESNSHYIEVNGTTLHYTKWGKGEPLLLLHGWTQTSLFWQPYIPALSEHYEVYAIDMRGHGKSLPLTSDFSIQKASRDIEAFITKLGLKRVRAVGLSFGGLALLELARTGNDMIHSMVIVGTSYDYNGAIAQKDKPVFRYEDMDPGFKKYLLEQHAHGEEQVRALFNPGLDYKISLQVTDLRQIMARVFIVHGDSDDIADPAQAVVMKKNIPKSALWVLPNAGHVPISGEAVQEFTQRTIDFFSAKN